ncbi:hypothetical protein JB92DRAFT_3068240 [Gautieria morchelliformis]|nr:hypothetical protein JB92DRAFT_3068240 [Gautieria morchelliformis]
MSAAALRSTLTDTNLQQDMPEMGSLTRNDDVQGNTLRLAHGIGPVGPGLRPVSKTLPTLPVEFPRNSGGSAPTSAGPKSRMSSGIPMTVFLSSPRAARRLRKQRKRWHQCRDRLVRPNAWVSAAVVSVFGHVIGVHRERATSNGSVHFMCSVLSVASVRSMFSVASGSTATGGTGTGARARPSLPAPKASSASVSPSLSPSDASSTFTIPTTLPCSSFAPAGPGSDSSTSTPRARSYISALIHTSSRMLDRADGMQAILLGRRQRADTTGRGLSRDRLGLAHEINGA